MNIGRVRRGGPVSAQVELANDRLLLIVVTLLFALGTMFAVLAHTSRWWLGIILWAAILGSVVYRRRWSGMLVLLGLRGPPLG
jgi:hypothetical protein